MIDIHVQLVEKRKADTDFDPSWHHHLGTTSWDHLDEKKEYQQGANVVDAAKEAGVQHLIISTLKDVTKLSNGEFPHVYHFDSKAKIAEYAKNSGVPTTQFMPGFYM